MTEIEIRGQLSPEKFKELFKLLTDNGQLSDHYHRLSVDLSAGFDPVTKTWENPTGVDIRLKKSDEKEKLTLKIGKYHELERKEIEIKLQTGQFLNTLDMLEVMGYQTGMIYFWESWEFDYLGVEIKLSQYTDNYFTFEIEGKTNLDVKKVAKNLDLTHFTATKYHQVIDWENQNIHHLYTKELVKKYLQEKF